MTDQLPDFMELYNQWEKLKPGPKADIRRVVEPDALFDRPVFFRLAATSGWKTNWRAGYARLVFCLPYLTHTKEGASLGTSLGRTGKISEKRMYQVIRAEWPNDIIQLRRILQHAKPPVDWKKVATQLWYWSQKADSPGRIRTKRQLLEDFVLAQPQRAKT